MKEAKKTFLRQRNSNLRNNALYQSFRLARFTLVSVVQDRPNVSQDTLPALLICKRPLVAEL